MPLASIRLVDADKILTHGQDIGNEYPFHC